MSYGYEIAGSADVVPHQKDAGVTTRLYGVANTLQNIENRLLEAVSGIHGPGPSPPKDGSSPAEPPPNLMSVVGRLEMLVQRVAQHADHVAKSL